MTPGQLRDYLTVLRECGAGEATVPVEGGSLTVRMTELPRPVSAFVDKDGTPVDLDAGNPWVDDERPDPVLSANFPTKAA